MIDGKKVDTTISQNECDALYSLYTNNGGATWVHRTGWDYHDSDPCTWYGVHCSSGHVDMISLPANNMTGSLSPEFQHLTGLEHLNLHDNLLSGDITIAMSGPAASLQTLELSDGSGGNNCLSVTNAVTDELMSVLDGDWDECEETCTIGTTPVVTVASQPECDALVGLYNATDGPNWTNHTGWNTPTDPCTWHGVTCSPAGVTKLELFHNNLTGPVPVSIGGLTNMTLLALIANHLASLPDEIGNLASLETFYMGDNPFPELPAGIGNLSNLTYLSVIQGDLRALPKEIGNLRKLKTLDVTANELTSLPDEMAGLDDIEDLGLAYNHLTGDITAPMAGIKDTLTGLGISDGPGFNNCLTVTDSSVAAWMDGLDKDWDECEGSCTIGTTPVVTVASQPECDALVGLYNATDGPNWTNHTGWNTPTDPCRWHGVTCSPAGVTKLEVFGNKLTGSVPASIGGLTNVTLLVLSDNHLTSLPDEIGDLASLEEFYVEANPLSSLPSGIGNLSNLTDLSVIQDHLTALPKEFGNLHKLEMFDMSGNYVTALPVEFGNLASLKSATIWANRLTGDITAQMAGVKDTLTYLKISDGPGMNNCLTITDPSVAAWMDGMDKDWDECDAGLPGANIVVIGGPAAVPQAVLAKLATLTYGSVSRVYGANRYATAAAISAKVFSPGVSTAYVATGDNFPDALAAGPAAGSEGAPILLVRNGSVPSETAQELNRLKPGRIVVVGGTAVVSNTVMSQLAAYTTGPVIRIAGPNRYATAAAVSASAFSPGVGTAIIATGANFPDALAGGPAGVEWGGPVLLVQQNAIPASTMTELKRLHPGRIVVLGGTSAVSASVAGQLGPLTTGSVVRYSGPDRYATAAAVSKALFPLGTGTAYVAIGTNFPDAVAAGPAAGMLHAPILLVGNLTVPPPTSTEVQRLGG